MSSYVLGQRFVSEPEPELGMGYISELDGYRVHLEFPASGEQRIYATGAAALKRAVFRVGERINARAGVSFAVESVEEDRGLLVYKGEGNRAREDELSDASSFSHPQDRLLSGQVDSNEAFELRHAALTMQNAIRSSELRGFLGGRVDLIPHQFYILKEVSSRQLPRVLLSDEVGLGKTIEACLILQRLRAVGRAERVLVIVPEALLHQWFVELLRRFNFWYSIYDEERCRAFEANQDSGNPFLDEQLAICSIEFLAQSEIRGRQAIDAGWDMVVVDEAHHLEWSEDEPSVEYQLVEELGSASPGLLLLTATPTQLGLAGHFARLRLLDPDRYYSLAAFRKEAEDFGIIASVANRILEKKPLNAEDKRELERIFHRDPDGLRKRLANLEAGNRGAEESLIQALLDEHGTGRVVFRNTRANMTGFPKRMYCPAPLASNDDPTLGRKLVRELEAESSNREAEIRYNFKGDPRLAWLVAFLRARKASKVLLICKSRQKAIALEAALREALNVKIGLFHEELQLVQRDRNAAWFAEEDGAQILICSEIGSEGRNFQFAHHLVLFDLPVNPGLLEQRIGRLDRIGQISTVQIHVPFVLGSPQEFQAEWFHQGLDAFETCLHGGVEYLSRFGDRLLQQSLEYGLRKKTGREELEVFVQETQDYREEISRKLREGRDRLLELNSFNKEVANDLVDRIRKAEKDTGLRELLLEILEFFGVRVDEQESGDAILDPSHAYVEGFPSLQADGSLVTFDRSRAIAREDIMFVSPDHSLVRDSIDLLVNSEKGKAAFSIRETDTQNMLIESVFTLEAVALSKLHVDRFLAPAPIRVVVDIRGQDLTADHDVAWTRSQLKAGDINRFLAMPGFSRDIMETMLTRGEAMAEGKANLIRKAAKKRASTELSREIERLEDLQKINENVKPEEIAIASAELEGILESIDEARLRLDSIRLILEGDVSGLV